MNANLISFPGRCCYLLSTQYLQRMQEMDTFRCVISTWINHPVYKRN